MKISSCNNVNDFRELARKNLPSPIFHYIDGAADDEVTCRNTAAYEDCFLVPRVLRSVETVDLGTKILGKKISLPFFYHLQLFKDFFITRVNWLLQKQLKNLILFSVFLPYQQFQ